MNTFVNIVCIYIFIFIYIYIHIKLKIYIVYMYNKAFPLVDALLHNGIEQSSTDNM